MHVPITTQLYKKCLCLINILVVGSVLFIIDRCATHSPQYSPSDHDFLQTFCKFSGDHPEKQETNLVGC